MAGESQQVPDSPPDPSVYVQAAIDRAARSERDWVLAQLALRDRRFDDIDKATEVLSETINRTPTEITKEVGHLKELVTEAMRSANDLVKYQTECSDKATTKQEAAFAKQIDALGVLLQKMNDTLSDRINDNKTRIDRMESNKLGGHEERTERRASNAAIFGTIAGVGAALGLLILLVGFLINQAPT